MNHYVLVKISCNCFKMFGVVRNFLLLVFVLGCNLWGLGETSKYSLEMDKVYSNVLPSNKHQHIWSFELEQEEVLSLDILSASTELLSGLDILSFSLKSDDDALIVFLEKRLIFANQESQRTPLLKPGTYHLYVQSNKNSSFTYSFKLSKPPAPENKILEINISYTNVLPTNEHRHIWSFEMEQEEALFMDVISVSGLPSFPDDSVSFSLRNNANEIIVSTVVYPIGFTSDTGRRTPLMKPGSYHLHVQTNSTQPLTYKFKMGKLPSPQVNDIMDFGFNVNGSINPPLSTDRWLLEAQSGSSIRLEIETLEQIEPSRYYVPPEHLLEFLDESGNILEPTQLVAFGFPSQREERTYTISSTGINTIQVYSEGNDTFNYRFKVWIITPDGAQVPVDPTALEDNFVSNLSIHPMDDHRLILSWDGNGAAPIVVERSENLFNWESWITIPTGGQREVVIDLRVVNGTEFYRLSPLTITPPIPPVSGGDPLTLSELDMRFMPIPSGSFVMGSPNSEEGRDYDEGPLTTVTISMPFWLGQTEITQGQWKAVMGNNPSWHEGDDLPVDSVSWDDAMAFCRKLNQDYGEILPPGYLFTLPTEAQWEYACRAGTTTRLFFGDDSIQLREYAWYIDTGRMPHPVGQLLPNGWGLYDIYGNVFEWCSDWYKSSYDGDSVTDPVGPSSGLYRVHRGGSWFTDEWLFRSAIRYRLRPDYSLSFLGFRVALISLDSH